MEERELTRIARKTWPCFRAPLMPLRRLAAAGFALFIVSNQSGVGRGYFTLEEVARVNGTPAGGFGPAGTRAFGKSATSRPKRRISPAGGASRRRTFYLTHGRNLASACRTVM